MSCGRWRARLRTSCTPLCERMRASLVDRFFETALPVLIPRCVARTADSQFLELSITFCRIHRLVTTKICSLVFAIVCLGLDNAESELRDSRSVQSCAGVHKMPRWSFRSVRECEHCHSRLHLEGWRLGCVEFHKGGSWPCAVLYACRS